MNTQALHKTYTIYLRGTETVQAILEQRAAKEGAEQGNGREHPCLTVPKRAAVVAVGGEATGGDSKREVFPHRAVNVVERRVDAARHGGIALDFNAALVNALPRLLVMQEWPG